MAILDLSESFGRPEVEALVAIGIYGPISIQHFVEVLDVSPPDALETVRRLKRRGFVMQTSELALRMAGLEFLEKSGLRNSKDVGRMLYSWRRQWGESDPS